MTSEPLHSCLLEDKLPLVLGTQDTLPETAAGPFSLVFTPGVQLVAPFNAKFKSSGDDDLSGDTPVLSATGCNARPCGSNMNARDPGYGGLFAKKAKNVELDG